MQHGGNCNSSWYSTHHSKSSWGVFFLGRLFPLGHQIGSFSLESSETGTQYASTLPYHQQTHHFWMAVWSDQSKMSHSDSQKVAASCKSMTQCTLSQRLQCELFHLKVSLWCLCAIQEALCPPENSCALLVHQAYRIWHVQYSKIAIIHL